MDKQEAAPRADGVVLSADVLQAVMFALENALVEGDDVAEALDVIGSVGRMANGGPVRVVRA
jgi:hypothetical protein